MLKINLGEQPIKVDTPTVGQIKRMLLAWDDSLDDYPAIFLILSEKKS